MTNECNALSSAIERLECAIEMYDEDEPMIALSYKLTAINLIYYKRAEYSTVIKNELDMCMINLLHDRVDVAIEHLQVVESLSHTFDESDYEKLFM
jgi:hypothetical protein